MDIYLPDDGFSDGGEPYTDEELEEINKVKVMFCREPYPDYMESMRGEVEIGAFFPDEIADFKGNMLCYSHVGQHSSASWEYFKSLQQATKEEYQDLFEELQSIGYVLDVLNKDK